MRTRWLHLRVMHQVPLNPRTHPLQVRGLAADGFPASFTSGVVDQIWQDEDIIVPRMRVHYTNVRATAPQTDAYTLSPSRES